MKGTWELLRQTLPFIWMRLVIYALFAVGSVILLALFVGIGLLFLQFGAGGGLVFILILLFIGSVFTLYRLLERYVLYLLKTAHIAVLVELIDHGEVPSGQGQIAYGKDKVKQMFGTATAFFAVDQLVHAAVKQVHRWLMRLGDFLNAIPGAKIVISIASMVLGIALNFIDEAVLSRVVKRKKDDVNSDVWKTSADGIVLYAQSWKKMIGTAAGVALFTISLTVVSFLIVLFPMQWIVQAIAGSDVLIAIAYISAIVISLAIKKALVDPVATIAMIRAYHTTTSGLEPDFDLKGKLTSISGKFRTLVQKEGSDVTTSGSGATSSTAPTRPMDM